MSFLDLPEDESNLQEFDTDGQLSRVDSGQSERRGNRRNIIQP